MNWLFPAFIGAAAMAALPVALHFLRRKPRQIIQFPTLRFLGATAVRETRKHRIRRWITLALRCAIFALLAAAFARPFWHSSGEAAGRAMIIAVDNSYSMQAADRWPALKSWASEYLARLNPGDSAGILLMNPAPSWLVPMTDNLAAARDAFATLEPGFYSTKYNASLRLAGETLARVDAHDRSLVWMADEQRIGWTGVDFRSPLPAGVKIVFPPAPQPVRQNAAITAAQLAVRDGKLAADVTVRLFGAPNVTRTVSVFLDGKQIGSAKGEISPEKVSTIRVPLDIKAPESALGIRIALDPDVLKADDTAYAVFDPTVGTKVLFATAPHAPGETDFLAHAIDSVKAPELQPLQRTPLPNEGNVKWPIETVALLRGGEAFRSPNVEKLDAFFASGGRAWLWVDGDKGQLAWLKKQGIEATPLPGREQPYHMRDFDLEHPLFASLGEKSLLPLLGVEFRTPWALKSPRLEPLARWEDQSTALGNQPVGRGELFLCGFAPSRTASNWPLQTSFVPFVHQVITWMAQSREKTRAWKVGDSIPLPDKAGTWIALDSPQREQSMTAQNAIVPSAPGLYRFTSGDVTKLFAVNLATEESDLSAWPNEADWRALQSKDAAPASATRHVALNLSAQEAERRQKLWWWLLAAVVICVVAELAIANRTAM